jgi:hypothetical protein
MSTETRFDESVGLLRQSYPLKFRLLELIAEQMLREAQGTDEARRQQMTRKPAMEPGAHGITDADGRSSM